MTAKKKGFYIQLYSIHGLIRSENVEYGRDADTGGQIKYVLELGKALSEDLRIEKVELITRQLIDKNVSQDYSHQEEKINDKFSIIRIRAGGGKYIRKELLWDHLEVFVDKSIKLIKSGGRLPDVIHSHYADAGYVCSELTKFFGIPFVHTGHSLGRAKLRRLLSEGLEMEDIEKFYPYNEERPFDEATKETIRSISEKLRKFFMDIDKPIILTLCRPDKRKNISGLIIAYGEDAELQRKANLAIFAGIRKDIQTMPDNEREVLTEILLLMDKYNLYGKMAIPKRHDTHLEVPELYRIAAETGGIFVNAALTEPFGLTLIESAASGVPIIATDDGGPRDIIANCQNGLLVDVSDHHNISNALNKILDDKKLWGEFSENGMKSVKKHYTWKAHIDKYLNELDKVFQKDTEKSDTFGHVGKKLLDMEKLIVTDIDHTLIGDDNSLVEFNKIICKVNSKIGFAVATGRTVDSAIEVLKEHNVELPIVIISSVGSEIYYNYKGELIYSKGWKAHIKHQWNREKIIHLLNQFDFLELQEEEGQREFKISYYTFENDDNLEKVKDVLIKNKIKTNIIFSHGQFLDILPYRASKGKAIRYLSYRWNIPYENILVAGDSGNDEEMLKGELLGVVVGNYSHELDYLRESKRVYFSNENYAGGIIDGINYYKFLTDGKGNLSE